MVARSPGEGRSGREAGGFVVGTSYGWGMSAEAAVGSDEGVPFAFDAVPFASGADVPFASDLDVGWVFPGGPGPLMLAGLLSTDLEKVDEAGLVDMIARLRQCAAQVDAAVAEVVAELATRQGGLTPEPQTEEELLDQREWERELLAARLRLSPGQARGLCETSVALATRLPRLSAALHAGEISWAHAHAVATKTSELDADQSALVESRILSDRRAITPGQFRFRAERLAAELSGPDLDLPEPERALHAERSAEGGVEISASLTAEGGHVVATCLDALASPTGPDDDRPIATRRADALVELCQWRLDLGDLAPTPGGARPHLTLLAGPDDLRAGSASGLALRTPGVGESPISTDVARRLTCDAGVAGATVDAAGRVVDLSRESRFPNAALRRRLDLRDQSCRFPGCTRQASRCHAHHVVHWADGGPTTLENMILACARHHHAVHEGGWQVHLDGADVQWTDPHGRRYHHPPPLAEPPHIDHPDEPPFCMALRAWGGRRRRPTWCRRRSRRCSAVRGPS